MMAERKPPEYYNTQKLWYPEGKEPSPEERFYSDPNVERGIVPALKSIAISLAALVPNSRELPNSFVIGPPSLAVPSWVCPVVA